MAWSDEARAASAAARRARGKAAPKKATGAKGGVTKRRNVLKRGYTAYYSMPTTVGGPGNPRSGQSGSGIILAAGTSGPKGFRSKFVSVWPSSKGTFPKAGFANIRVPARLVTKTVAPVKKSATTGRTVRGRVTSKRK